jgi:hypothetical protein
MPAKKIRVEVFDGGGNRYTITFDGQVTREKALRLLDIVELLGGMPGVNLGESQTISNLSKQDKVRFFVGRNFPIVWFSSKDVQNLYEKELKEPISLSTISTYLSRMADRGILAKSSASNKIRYRIITQMAQDAVNLVKDNK